MLLLPLRTVPFRMATIILIRLMGEVGGEYSLLSFIIIFMENFGLVVCNCFQ